MSKVIRGGITALTGAFFLLATVVSFLMFVMLAGKAILTADWAAAAAAVLMMSLVVFFGILFSKWTKGGITPPLNG